MEKIAEAVEVINQSFNEANRKRDNASYSKLSVMLSEFEDGLREFIQQSTKDKIQLVIKKLQSGQNLNEDDLSVARLWLVGDAEYYANVESDVSQWSTELNRLVTKINELKQSKLDVHNASTLRAILLDAMRTAASISFFLQQKERVEKFTSTIRELDDEERTMMTQILVSKLKSEKY